MANSQVLIMAIMLVEIADNLLKIPKCPIIRTRFEDDKYFNEPDERRI